MGCDALNAARVSDGTLFEIVGTPHSAIGYRSHTSSHDKREEDWNGEKYILQITWE